ncbi:hypothetical protein QBC39DRAFT_331608 [Podospora conica]|nr:hypothetical protein QBC39DRAFT_331608 [Schizothecium conicum]
MADHAPRTPRQDVQPLANAAGGQAQPVAYTQALAAGGRTRPTEPPSPTNLQPAKRQKGPGHHAPGVAVPKAPASTNTTRPQWETAAQEALRQSAADLKHLHIAMGTFVAQLTGGAALHPGPYEQVVREYLDELATLAIAEATARYFSGPRLLKRQASNDWVTVASRTAQNTRYTATVNIASGNRSRGPAPKRKGKGKRKPRHTQRRDELSIIITAANEDQHGYKLFPMEPFVLRHRLSKALGITNGHIEKIHATPSGWSLKLIDGETRDLFLNPANRVAILAVVPQGMDIVRPVQWFRYAVKELPVRLAILDEDGQPTPTLALIEEEATVQTGVKPCEFSQSRYGPDVLTGRCTFIVSFNKEVRPFRLFNTGCGRCGDSTDTYYDEICTKRP